MYTKLMPVTHHFYPLQEHEDKSHQAFKVFSDVLSKHPDHAPKSLIYLHVPFCEKHCLFCPFHTRVGAKKSVYSSYVDSLIKEMRLLRGFPYLSGRSYQAVYIGGGSPSMLSLHDIKRIYDALRHYFVIDSDAEWTFEGEPHTLRTDGLIRYLASEHTQRVSFGVQTFDAEVRRMLNIAATVEDVNRCVEICREHGIPEVNADMMFHLPGQSMMDLEADLNTLIQSNFDSVDYYYLSYYGFSKQIVEKMRQGTFPTRPTVKSRFEMNRMVRKYLIDRGYHHVTDHVFSKKLESSRYYQILWGGGYGLYRDETLAIGASARGYLGGVSYANTLNYRDYMKEVEQDRLPLYKLSGRLTDPANRGRIFFPKFFRMPVKLIPKKSKEYLILKKLEKLGYIVKNAGDYQITELGKDWIPNITVDLFEDEQKKINDIWIDKLNSHYFNRVTL